MDGRPGALYISLPLFIIALSMERFCSQSALNVMSPWVVASNGDCQVTPVENAKATRFDQLLSWSKALVTNDCSECWLV